MKLRQLPHNFDPEPLLIFTPQACTSWDVSNIWDPLVCTFTFQAVSLQTVVMAATFPLNIPGKLGASTSSLLYNIPLDQNGCPEVREAGQLSSLPKAIHT